MKAFNFYAADKTAERLAARRHDTDEIKINDSEEIGGERTGNDWIGAAVRVTKIPHVLWKSRQASEVC